MPTCVNVQTKGDTAVANPVVLVSNVCGGAASGIVPPAGFNALPTAVTVYLTCPVMSLVPPLLMFPVAFSCNVPPSPFTSKVPLEPEAVSVIDCRWFVPPHPKVRSEIALASAAIKIVRFVTGILRN